MPQRERAMEPSNRSSPAGAAIWSPDSGCDAGLTTPPGAIGFPQLPEAFLGEQRLEHASAIQVRARASRGLSQIAC